MRNNTLQMTLTDSEVKELELTIGAGAFATASEYLRATYKPFAAELLKRKL